MKRIIIITASILILAVLVYAGIQLLTGESVTPVPGTQPGVTVGDPIIEEQVMAVADDLPILNYWFNNADGLLYYITTDGEIYKVRAPQVSERVSGTKIQNLISAAPSADGTSVIIKFDGLSNPSFSAFTVATKKWNTLPADTTSAAWNPASSSQIAYLTSAGPLGGVYLFNTGNAEVTRLSTVNVTGLDIIWNAPDELYLVDKPARGASASMWALTVSTKTFRPITDGKYGLMSLWSPDGQTGIQFSLPSVSQVATTLINTRGETLGTFPFVTLPSKCVFAGANNTPATRTYCGVPYDVDLARAGLPDTYLQHSFYTADDIYEVPLSSISSPKKIFTGVYREAPLDIDQPLINGTMLYFLNRYDQSLYSIDLRLVK